MVLVKMRETAEQFLNKKIKQVHSNLPRDFTPTLQFIAMLSSPSLRTSMMHNVKQLKTPVKLLAWRSSE